MKVLVIGDAGTHSGFGSVIHSIGERLVRDYGHDLHVLAANYRGDYYPTNLKLYPANRDEPKDIVGMSRFIRITAEVMPEAILFVNDPVIVMNSLLKNPWDTEQVLWRGMKGNDDFLYKPPILAYMPIDGYDTPREWDILTQRVTRIAMTHFGQQAMPEAPVIWHGVDTSVFHPRDKREAKKALGFDPDRFLVLRVDKNSIRKDYPSTYKALRPILRRHPDIDVHFHCLPNTSAIDGYNLNALRFNDEDIRDRVSFTPGLGGFLGASQEQLATLYAAADLFVTTSWGEGFGLTILEAMASGTPVIAQDCSAITEVVGDAGILVKPKGRITMPMGQEMCLPDVDKFTYWIEHLYGARKMRERLAEAAAERATQFSWDEAARRFNDQLTQAIAP